MIQQRSQVIIKDKFQHQLILSTLLITLITLNVIIVAAFFLDSLYGSEDALFNVFTVAVAGMEIVAVVVVYYIGRRISFHIAGPIYAIERTLKGMQAGDLAQVLRLRTGDQFEEVAKAVNEVMSNYRERIAKLQSALEVNRELSPEQLQQLLEELRWFVTERDR